MLLALALAALQGTSCNNSNYHLVSHAGLQPDAEVSTPCGGTSVTVHIKLDAELGVILLDGAVEGSISVTIQTPESCPLQHLKYEGDIHECGPPLQGYHCNPLAAKVKVQLFKAEPPCPTIPVNLSQFLGGFLALLQSGQAQITVPCNELKDVTDTLPDSAKVRNTARIRPCKGTGSPSAPLEQTEPVEVGLHHHLHDGDPKELDLDALVPDGTTLPGLVAIEGGDDLIALLTSGSGALPAVLEEVDAHHGNLGWFDDLSCVVTSSYEYQEGGEVHSLSATQLINGNFRDNGDYLVELPSAAPDGPGGEGGTVPFLTRWLCLSGDLYCAERSSTSGVIYPEKNGAATLPLAMDLRFVPELRDWVSDPFRLRRGDAFRYTVSAPVPGTLVVEGSLAYQWAEGATPVALVAALLGPTWTHVVDTSGPVPRIVETTRRHFTGSLARRTTYGSYAEVAPGVWRPMELGIEEFGEGERLERSSTLSLSGFRRAGEAPRALAMPKPLADRWAVLLGL